MCLFKTFHNAKIKQASGDMLVSNDRQYMMIAHCYSSLFFYFQVAIMSFGMPRLSDYYMKHIFNHIMIFAYGFLHTFRVGSVYVTLAVTFERFHAIICPLRHFKRKKYMLPACIVFAVVYNLPKYFELQIVVRKNFNLICIYN